MMQFTGTTTIDTNQFFELVAKAEKSKELAKQNAGLKALLMGKMFREYDMKYRSRSEQATVYPDGTVPYGFGFSDSDILVLKEYNVTIADMVAFINGQWDIKEAEEKAKQEPSHTSESK